MVCSTAILNILYIYIKKRPTENRFDVDNMGDETKKISQYNSRVELEFSFPFTIKYQK